MFSIGEFSRITGLTVKTLRFYHEQELLVPSFVDPQTAYRNYDPRQIESARMITYLRGLDFSISDIKEILRLQGEEEILVVMDRHKATLREKVKKYNKAVRSIDEFIHAERKAIAMAQVTYQIQEKMLDAIVIGGIRMKGRYGECGKGFAKLGRSLGRRIRGAPFLLHYNTEYREEDADFEACMPIAQGKAVEGISVRELPGGKCVSLLHKGPYEHLGNSYAKILQYVKEKEYRIIMPTREVYIKGPGMIFKGNPKNYLTEIEILVEAMTP